MTESAYEQGKRLAKQGRFEEALPCLEQAAKEQNDSPEVWLALGACYFRVERHDEFRDAVRKALALDPDHAPTKKFLRQITGTEIIPAADTGRPKIEVEEGAGALDSSDRQEDKAKSGCLGILVAALTVVFLTLVFSRS
jgi:tetratricopeptide (TPR) repeat protein